MVGKCKRIASEDNGSDSEKTKCEVLVPLCARVALMVSCSMLVHYTTMFLIFQLQCKVFLLNPQRDYWDKLNKHLEQIRKSREGDDKKIHK